MGEVVALFDAVAAGLLDSFAATVDQVFTVFEVHGHIPDVSEQTLDDALEATLTSFLHEDKEYSRIIETLSQLAVANSAAVVIHLCNKFRAECTRTIDSGTPTTITIQAVGFRATNVFHFQFARHLSLMFLTDLIYAIFSENPVEQACSKLVSCGYNLCTTQHHFEKMHHALIEKWSYIFLFVSRVALNEIVISFEQFADETNMGLVYWLISRVRGTQSFVDSLLYSVQMSRKKKTLTMTMLSALGLFLSLVECNEEALNEFYSIAWSLRSDGKLKDGAFDVLVSVSARLPQQKKLREFVMSRLQKTVVEDDKVEKTAQAFLLLIRGDVSGVEYRRKLGGLNYVGCGNVQANKQDAADSYANTFLKTFFPKANFRVCIDVFSDIIMHLAALDMGFFEKDLTLQFITLKSTDPRLIAFLRAVVQMNDPFFVENALCKPTSEKIQSVNSFVRAVVFNLMPYLSQFAVDRDLVLLHESLCLVSKINEADQVVMKFMKQNRYDGFERTFGHFNTGQVSNQNVSFAPYAIQCITYSTTVDDLADGSLAELLIKLGAVKYKDISDAALRAYHSFVDHNMDNKQIFVTAALKILRSTKSRELIAHCLALVYEALQGSCFQKIPEETKADIELLAFTCLFVDVVYHRVLAWKILRRLVAGKCAPNTGVLFEQGDQLSDVFNRCILVLYVPEVPVMITTPLGTLSASVTCCSRYTDLWIIFLSEMMNILVTEEKRDFIMKLRAHIEPRVYEIQKLIIDGDVSAFTAAAWLMLFIDTFAIDVSISQCEEEDYVVPDMDLGARPLIESILSSPELQPKKCLIKAFSYLNWRVIPSVLHTLLLIDQELYSDAAASVSFIIQNPENFKHIISTVFSKFVEFMAMIQSYLIQLQINSAREITWDEEHISLLREHEELCVNYCVIISAAFNNIQSQAPEDHWPLSYRQVLVQFLIHWNRLPEEFQRIRLYAMNALIPILHAGTVFTEGFSFDLNMLELLVACQLDGYPVLDSLLYFHIDILLDEFVKNFILKPRRDAQLFLDAIMTVLDQVPESSILQAHVGSLLLLALYLGTISLDDANYLLQKIAALFLEGDGDFEEMIQNATDFDYVPNMFQFGTEQLIDFAFYMLRICKPTVTRVIVNLLIPWFEKIRILPTHSVIIQGVPSKYRKYTVMTFLEAMLKVSTALDEERNEIFTDLWYSLLSTSDNSTVLLLCLFESENDDDKVMVFTQLLNREPAMIAKYLAKRLSFAFWYFMKTERQMNTSSIKWVIKVMTLAFIDHVAASAPRFTLALHFSLLFIEDSKSLFEALVSVFGIEIIDVSFVWVKDAATGIIRVSSIVQEIVGMLKGERQEAIEKWSNEAMRWVVGCCDIHLAYRSLVIMNALDCTIPSTYVPLLCDAVHYHLGRASEDNCDDVVDFVAVCFELLYKPISTGDVSILALQFANVFLNSRIFDKALRMAFPIFMFSVEHPILERSTKDVMVDAIIPFLPHLETDAYAQQLLKQALDVTESPILSIIAAAFVRTSIPFVDMGKPYTELIGVTVRIREADTTLKCFGVLMKSASDELVDSIIAISNKLVVKFEKHLDKRSLYPIYQAALQRISVMKSAVELMTNLMRLNPGIAQFSYDPRDIGKGLNDIRSDIAGLMEQTVDIVPMTNCKQVAQLKGLIDQQHPPKIYPFASHHEVYLKLKQDDIAPTSGRHHRKRWSSSMSMASGLISHKSMILPSTQFGFDFAAMPLEGLPHVPLSMERLAVTTAGPIRDIDIIISPTEFLQLDL